MRKEKQVLIIYFSRLIALFVIVICGCQQKTQIVEPKKDETVAELSKIREKIVPFFKPMKIESGDWLESFPENGQTFEQYLTANPTLPTAERKTIYIQPIGEFSETQKQVLLLTADYMKAFYNLPVKLNETKPLGIIPKEFKRKNPVEKHTQLKTWYFLEEVLPDILPDDAAALICFTNYDLYPDENWNYVFGSATLFHRVGVWSLWRLGKTDNGVADYKLLLQRTLKVAMHETGHMFTIQHCTKYKCLMSGSNHLEEIDSQPVDVCPECMAKIAWGMDYQPTERYRNLSKFWKENDFEELSREFDAKEKAVLK